MKRVRVGIATCAVIAAAAIAIAATPARHTTPATQDATPAHLVVLYNTPKDPAAFEKYYAASHLPLLASHAKEIGFTNGVLVKFAPGADGKAPALYRKAELTFASMDALKKGTATPGFQAVGADIPKFATGGFTVLVGEETK
jgi:uncharacterized protein (TIGR02118 family)